MICNHLITVIFFRCNFANSFSDVVNQDKQCYLRKETVHFAASANFCSTQQKKVHRVTRLVCNSFRYIGSTKLKSPIFLQLLSLNDANTQKNFCKSFKDKIKTSKYLNFRINKNTRIGNI